MGTMNATPMDLSYDKGWANQNYTGRRSLTPQDLLNMASLSSYRTTGGVNFSDDGKVRFETSSELIFTFYIKRY